MKAWFFKQETFWSTPWNCPLPSNLSWPRWLLHWGRKSDIVTTLDKSGQGGSRPIFVWCKHPPPTLILGRLFQFPSILWGSAFFWIAIRKCSTSRQSQAPIHYVLPTAPVSTVVSTKQWHSSHADMSAPPPLCALQDVGIACTNKKRLTYSISYYCYLTKIANQVKLKINK